MPENLAFGKKNKNKNNKNNPTINNIFNINILKNIKINTKKNPPKKRNNIFKSSSKNISTILSENNSKSKIHFIVKKLNNSLKNKKNIFSKENKKINIDKELKTLTDKEINSLKYEEALKYDKRSYIIYYLSLLKTKHLLIFSFITKNDYNSRVIKICLFFFSFTLLYTINSFFFQEKDIHKIYEDKETFDFIYQIPQILYSTIISLVINYLIKYFSLSSNNIIELKKNKNNNKEDFNRVVKCLTIKIIIFYIMDLLFLLFFLVLFRLLLCCF